MKKTVRIGSLKEYGNIYCEIKFVEGKLSISGVIGPMKNGDCHGGCGQIDMEFAHRNPADNDSRYSNPIKPEEITFAPGWDAEKWFDFLEAWKHWHLNDMRPGCEHQKDWGKKKLQVIGYDGRMETKTSGWVYPREHEEGELTKPCPVCGYEYGSKWLKEDVPAEVITFLQSLPETDKTPAWV
jgi:hypothetical protein